MANISATVHLLGVLYLAWGSSLAPFWTREHLNSGAPLLEEGPDLATKFGFTPFGLINAGRGFGWIL